MVENMVQISTFYLLNEHIDKLVIDKSDIEKLQALTIKYCREVYLKGVLRGLGIDYNHTDCLDKDSIFLEIKELSLKRDILCMPMSELKYKPKFEPESKPKLETESKLEPESKPEPEPEPKLKYKKIINNTELKPDNKPRVQINLKPRVSFSESNSNQKHKIEHKMKKSIFKILKKIQIDEMDEPEFFITDDEFNDKEIKTPTDESPIPSYELDQKPVDTSEQQINKSQKRWDAVQDTSSTMFLNESDYPALGSKRKFKKITDKKQDNTDDVRFEKPVDQHREYGQKYRQYRQDRPYRQKYENQWRNERWERNRFNPTRYEQQIQTNQGYTPRNRMEKYDRFDKIETISPPTSIRIFNYEEGKDIKIHKSFIY